MSKSNKFSPEVRERAARMVQEQRGKYPSLRAATGYILPGGGRGKPIPATHRPPRWWADLSQAASAKSGAVHFFSLRPGVSIT
jgi:hypothetical protein